MAFSFEVRSGNPKISMSPLTVPFSAPNRLDGFDIAMDLPEPAWRALALKG